MKKYAHYYYSTKKTKGGYIWTIRNKDGEALQVCEQPLKTKRIAEIEAQDHIQEYYD